MLERILCVEDDPDIQDVAKLALETLGGFKVTLCSSGADALEKAAAVAPDMILLDVMMPGMDGPDTLTALRQKPALAAVPVAFMTARVQPEEVARYHALGACGVIAKPFDPMTLANQVKALWQEATS
ncbi:response regulator [Halomonas vilamensis]|uniref:Response regulator n=1 Tax=Vreelandella vilamensis TaxID=531309 RepID=A0ABU1H9G9_9GAMM|nr:response regulator [Halomonas vilamensis]MDR5900362.1 response regulator [Halomonas vilamensis]